MTTKTITQLPSASALEGTELFESVQTSGGFPTSVKTQARNIVQSPIRYMQFENADNPDYPAQSWQEGLIQWDRDNHTLAIFNDIPAVTHQVGQETFMVVRNESGATIPDGTPVYISGVSSIHNRPLVAPAKGDSSFTLISPSVVTHNMPNNTNGYATKHGIVRDIDTSELIAGMPLFVSPVSAGVLTNTRPVSPNRIAIIGITTISHATSGAIWVEPAQLAHGLESITYTLPLAGVVDSIVPLQGDFTTLGTSATGDIATDLTIGNNHAFIKVNTLTTGGDIVITGDSIDEVTAIITTDDTETITVDPSASRPASLGSQYYQTNKKWWAITNIDVSSGTIAGINYNYGTIGYPDAGNRNFRILGYRLEAYSAGPNPDIRFRLFAVKDDGQKRMRVLPIEDIGIDADGAGDQIIDHIRTGGDDRSYNSPIGNLWPDNRKIVFKQGDFHNYWNAIDSRHELDGKDSNEGLVMLFEGEPVGGITNVDWIVLTMEFELR